LEEQILVTSSDSKLVTQYPLRYKLGCIKAAKKHVFNTGSKAQTEGSYLISWGFKGQKHSHTALVSKKM